MTRIDVFERIKEIAEILKEIPEGTRLEEIFIAAIKADLESLELMKKHPDIFVDI